MKLTIDEIREILPHRYPFLLIDRVEDGEAGQWARAIKCVTANEPFFSGHFPGKSIMPGVLIIEAMAQTGGVALLAQQDSETHLAVIGGVKNVRFIKPVVPGDILELECRITRRRGSIGIAEAAGRVNGNIVATAELTFALTRR